MAFTAKDVQALRQATGAGMMDAKKALEANDGDIEAAKQVAAREGPRPSAKRDDRENTQGVVALVVDGNVGAIVELKCETDFVAGPSSSRPRPRRWPTLVAAKGDDAVAERARTARRPEDHAQGEHRARARSSASRPPPGNVLDSYLHVQGGRGVNGVLVELAGGTQRAGPRHRRAHRLRPAEVPQPRRRARADVVDDERATLEAITRNEGKPEQALAEDRRGPPQRLLQGRRACSSSPTPRTTSRSITQLLGGATIVALRPGRDRLSHR